jgi:hypothetical protein
MSKQMMHIPSTEIKPLMIPCRLLYQLGYKLSIRTKKPPEDENADSPF